MKNERGITLIELMISLLLSSIIMVASYQVVVNSAKAYSIQDSVAEAQNASRAGMEILVSDLRMAGYDKQNETGGSTVTPSAVSGGPHWVKVEWELDNLTIRGVHYYLRNAQLVRDVYINGVKQGETQEVLDDVQDLTFSFSIAGTTYTKADLSLTLKPVLFEQDKKLVFNFRNFTVLRTEKNLANRTLVSSVIFRNAK